MKFAVAFERCLLPTEKFENEESGSRHWSANRQIAVCLFLLEKPDDFCVHHLMLGATRSVFGED